MLLEQLLSSKSQLLAVPGLEHLPDTELTRYLRQYLISCKVDGKSPKTLIAYCDFVGYFIRFMADASLNAGIRDINRNHIRLFIVTLQERKLAPETVNAYYRALHTFFNWLEGEKYLTEIENPFNSKNLHAPKIPKKHVQGLPQDILNHVFTLCSVDTSFIGTRNYAMVLIFSDTGIRQEEMAGMKLTNIYFEQGLIRVMGKGAKERIVKMGEVTQKALLKYLLMRKDNHESVWVTDHGQPLTQRGISIAIQRIAQRADIPRPLKHGTHIYRHTAATNYLRNHGNVKCLQELMGHENIKTTMKYVDALGPEAAIEDHRLASPVDNFFKYSEPVNRKIPNIKKRPSPD
jgi:site-specific recombinase XerD